eukprot:1142314-Pelagomonas_calceolata.AAC.1
MPKVGRHHVPAVPIVGCKVVVPIWMQDGHYLAGHHARSHRAVGHHVAGHYITGHPVAGHHAASHHGHVYWPCRPSCHKPSRCRPSCRRLSHCRPSRCRPMPIPSSMDIPPQHCMLHATIARHAAAAVMVDRSSTLNACDGCTRWRLIKHATSPLWYSMEPSGSMSIKLGMLGVGRRQFWLA